MNYYDFQGFGIYAQTGTASTLKERDYKDATDLIERERERGFYGYSSTAAYTA